MPTTIVNADFAVPDGTLLSDYSSTPGGSWALLPNLSPPLPPASGDASHFVINGGRVELLDGSTICPIGPADAQVSFPKFTASYNFAFLADAETVGPNVGFGFCGDSALGTGYFLNAFYSGDFQVTYQLLKAADGVGVVAEFGPQPLAIGDAVPVSVDFDFSTGLITVNVNGVPVINYTDPSPLTGTAMGMFMAGFTTSSVVTFWNFVLVDNTEPPAPPEPSGITYLSPIGNSLQGFTNNGVPMSFGKLYSFIAGTTTPLATYSDVNGNAPNTNPIVLDSAGRVPNQVRFVKGTAYKLSLVDANDVPVWTQDNLVGINDITAGAADTGIFWINFGTIPVRLSETSFSLIGNWSVQLPNMQRIQIQQGSSTLFGSVLTTHVTEVTPGSYSTEVTVRFDSGVLLSDITAGFYSDINAAGNPCPIDLDLKDQVSLLTTQITQIQSSITNIDATISNAVPTGTVIAWGSGSVPSGWMVCNGQAISRATYSSLFNIVGTTFGAGDGFNTFNLPDLRGVFIRGLDQGRGIDIGRVLGSFQNWQMTNHTHWTDNSCTGRDARGYDNLSMSCSGDFAFWGPRHLSYEGGTENGNETRPANVSMVYLIRVADSHSGGGTSYTPIGVGQTWQDVTTSRILGASYTNTTPQPIQVSVTVQTTGTTTGAVPVAAFNISGVVVGRSTCGDSTGTDFGPAETNMTYIVPSGATYSVTLVSGVTTNTSLLVWAELRS